MKSITYMYHYFVTSIPHRGDDGQSTAEYSLVILGAAAVALLLLSWAGSTGSITNLFESVISRVASKAP